MSKMRAVRVARPNAPFEIVEREIPDPGPGSVRVKVQACGICHSDTLTKEGTFPLVQYPVFLATKSSASLMLWAPA